MRSVIRQRSGKKNYRDSFTKILGSHEALYELGINVHSEDDFNFENSNTALMTTPPQNIVNLLRDESDTNNNFVVGIETPSPTFVQDPYEFQPEQSTVQVKRDSRPRGGGKEKAKIVKMSFRDEINEIVVKTALIMEKKFGRRLLTQNSTMDAEGLEEESCDENALNATQDRCLVSWIFRQGDLPKFEFEIAPNPS